MNSRIEAIGNLIWMIAFYVEVHFHQYDLVAASAAWCFLTEVYRLKKYLREK